MKNELNQLLKEHKAKRRRELDVEDAEEQGHQKFQVLAVNAIEKVIGPALMVLGKELKDHGHEAGVSLLVGVDAYPSAHLSFLIVDQDETHSAASASRLSFSTTASQDKFEIRSEIWGREGKEAGTNAGKPEAKPIAEVDAAWVTAQGMAFIRHVLERA